MNGMDARLVIELPTRLGFAIAGAALSAVEASVAVSRIAIENVQHEITVALGVSQGPPGRSPLQLIGQVAELLEDDRSLGRVLARGGPLERLVSDDGLVNRMLSDDGVLYQMTEDGGPLDRLLSRGGPVDRKSVV